MAENEKILKKHRNPLKTRKSIKTTETSKKKGTNQNFWINYPKMQNFTGISEDYSKIFGIQRIPGKTQEKPENSIGTRGISRKKSVIP